MGVKGQGVVRTQQTQPAAVKQQQDPVCGKKLEVGSAAASAEYKQKKYFFCSERCRHAFERQTERFRLNELAKAGALMTPGRVRWGMA